MGLQTVHEHGQAPQVPGVMHLTLNLIYSSFTCRRLRCPCLPLPLLPPPPRRLSAAPRLFQVACEKETRGGRRWLADQCWQREQQRGRVQVEG
jgi:hypothetical protein